MAATVDSKTVSIEVPADVLAAIDELVGADHRAEFVREALVERLDRARRLRAFNALADRLEAADPPGWETSGSSADWVRRLRGEWDASIPEHGNG